MLKHGLIIVIIKLLLIDNIFGLDAKIDDLHQTHTIDVNDEDRNLTFTIEDLNKSSIWTFIKVNVNKSSGDIISFHLTAEDGDNVNGTMTFYLTNDTADIIDGNVNLSIRMSDLQSELESFDLNISIQEPLKPHPITYIIKKLNCSNCTEICVPIDTNTTESDILNNTDNVDSDKEEESCEKHCEYKEFSIDDEEGTHGLNCTEFNVTENDTIYYRDNRTYVLSYTVNKYKDYRLKDNDNFTINDTLNIFIYENNREIIKKDKKIILTVLGTGLNDFNFFYSLEPNIEKEQKIEIKQFFNGYAFIIDKSTFNGKAEEQKLVFNLSNNSNETIHIKSRKYSEKEQTIDDGNNHFDIILKPKTINMECFNIEKKDSDNYVINFLSLTKNVNAEITGDDINRKIEINKESMIYLIENKANKICFEIDNKENYDFGSLSFELMKTNINNTFNLIRGLPIHHYLAKGKAAIYSPERYIKEKNFIKINFHMTKGKTFLYLIDCNDCEINYEDLKSNYSKYNDINGFISAKLDYKKHQNLVAIVYCPDEQDECEYDIEMKQDGEETYLYNDLRIFSFADYDEIYKINTKGINENIAISVNSFNSEPDVKIFNNKSELINNKTLYFMNNKYVYIIGNNAIQNNDNIFIEINDKNTNYYYGIYYEINSIENNISLETGMLYFNKLDDVNAANFYFINKGEDCKENHVNVNTFGNSLTLKYNDTVKNPDNDLINADLNSCTSFSIEDGNNNDNKNVFNIEYNEKTNHNKIIIDYGYMYTNRLTSTDNEAVYSLILFNDENNSDNKYIINFRKYTNTEVNLIINDDNKTIKELSKIIVLNETELNCNYDSYCELIIKINVDPEKIKNEYIDFSIQVTKNVKDETEDNLDSKAIYLPHNTFMSNLLISNYNQSYYTYIGTKSYTKIYIDFLEGEGKAKAKINNDDIEFDYKNKYFDIENYTKYCSENSEECKIFIYVYLDKETESYYKYNIYTKTQRDNFYFNVPELEYIFGHLGKDNTKDFYKTRITKKTTQLAFHINCDDCLLTIYDDNDNDNAKDIPIAFNQEYIYTINKAQKDIKYSIENNNGTEIINQNYYIKIISFNENEQLYIPVNSIRNEFCYKKDINTSCTFLFTKEKYNKIKTLRFLVPNKQNAKITVNKDSNKNKLVKQNINNDIIVLNCKSNSSTEKICIYELNNEEVDEEAIYIIEVQLNYIDKITLVSSLYDASQSNLMNYSYKEDYNIIYLESKSNIKISPLIEDRFLIYDINLIRGEGTIQLDNNENYILRPGFKENLNILQYSKLNTKTTIKNNDEKNNFIFYYRIIVNNGKNNNLVELNFQRSNNFKYINTQNDTITWPLQFFMKINNENNLTDININYKFFQQYTNNIPFDGNEDKYYSNVTIVEQSYIIKQKFNPSKETKEPVEQENLDIKSDYREEFTAGYTLIDKNNLENLDTKKDYYFFIEIYDERGQTIKKDDKDINVVLTAFDFSDNYFLSMNEYILMFINKSTSLHIGNNMEDTCENKLFIEFASININYTNQYGNKYSYGKYFIDMTDKGETTIDFYNNSICSDNKTNLLIKYGISDYDDYSYFKLDNNKITFDNNTIIYDNITMTYYNETIISFYSLTENTKNENTQNDDSIYVVYNIRIYNLTEIEEEDFEPNSILENKKQIFFKKMVDNNTNAKLSFDISELDYGYYYISILAEARKGDVYEYLSYEPTRFKKIKYESEENITINYQNNSYIPRFSRDVKYIANIDYNSSIDKDFFIKLSLKHNNSSKNHYIFVSDDKKIFNMESSNDIDLYSESQYKTMTRETSIIIPVNKLSENKSLYIRIPCDMICDYTFNYIIISNSNIPIYDNECFDMPANGTQYSYHFEYSSKTNENKESLFTFTSYSIQDFDIMLDNRNNLKKTFFNGYSYTTNNISKNITFEIKYNLKIKICHKFLNENNEINDAKDIFNGEIKYINIKEGQECYKILKDTYESGKTIDEYRITFITKTKNLIFSYENEGEKNTPELNSESQTLFLPSTTDKFCIKSENGEEGGVLFQLLSVYDNNEMTQHWNMPLISGVSTRQTLKKGQILYYKTDESVEGHVANVHFQALSGNPKLYYYSKHKDSLENIIANIETLNDEKKGINNNILAQDDINGTPFPIYIVYCDNDDGDDYCDYFIEMSYDNAPIQLNKNRKIYSFIQNRRQNYKIDLPPNEIENSSIYIQLYSFTGNTTIISSSNKANKVYQYNENTWLYVYKLEVDSSEFNFDIDGESNSYYNLFYYTISNKDENNMMFLQTGEVHYIILPSNTSFNYYFTDSYSTKTDNTYIVSISGMSNYLNVYKKDEKKKFMNEEEQKKNHQIEIIDQQKIKIKCLKKDGECEFTISSIELNKGKTKTKELIFNDRTYHYFKFSNDFNGVTIKYLMPKINEKEEKEDSDIFININKKTDKELILKFDNDNNDISIVDYNEMKKLNKKDFIQYKTEDNNLNQLVFTIMPLVEGDDIDDIEFKIRINGNKKLPSQLDNEENEYGRIEKGHTHYYYYDYFYKEDNENNTEQIYLDCKGIAKISKIIKYNNKINNGEEIYNNNNDIYIDLNYQQCKGGCKIKFSVTLQDDQNNANAYSIYNIYILSSKRPLNVYENKNIYGFLDKNAIFSFKTKVSEKNGILFNINCISCKVTINDNQSFNKSIVLNDISGTELNYRIENDGNEKNYFYFSVINSNKIKYVYQKESIICQNNSKLILPLYSYFDYNMDEILLYVPEYETIEIYSKFLNEADLKNLTDFDLAKGGYFNSTKSLITNRLFVNISEYKDKDEDKYLLIIIKSKDKNNDNNNDNFNLIVSQFYQSNNDDIIYPYNIFMAKNKSKFNIGCNKYLNRLHLISGSGKILLGNNSNENNEYLLDYESQEIIHFVNPSNSILVNNASDDFIFYSEVMKNENQYNLVVQKANYIKSLNSNSPPCLVLENKKKNLYINYYYSYSTNNNTVYNINDTQVIITDKNKPGNKGESDTLRRGCIYIENIAEDKYLYLQVEVKSSINLENIELIVVPLYLDEEEKIELPRNSYLEIRGKDIEKFYLSKPKEDYKNVKIELAFLDNIDINVSSIGNIYGKAEKENGKYSLIDNSNDTSYNMSINNTEIDGKVLIKYITTKESLIFNICDYNGTIKGINVDRNNSDNNTFNITHGNIKVNNNIPREDLKISFTILLYNVLYYYEDKEVNTIFSNATLSNSFRRELSLEEIIKTDKVTHIVNFGYLDYGQYCVSVIGEVVYKNNIEYLSYSLNTFDVKIPKKIIFDNSCFIPLGIVIGTLIILVVYLILYKKYWYKKNDEVTGKYLLNKEKNEIIEMN